MQGFPGAALTSKKWCPVIMDRYWLLTELIFFWGGGEGEEIKMINLVYFVGRKERLYDVKYTKCEWIMVPSSWLKFSLRSHRMIACATDDTKLWFSLSVKQCQNPWSRCHLCTRIWVCAMTGCWKSHCHFVNKQERKFKMHFQ